VPLADKDAGGLAGALADAVCGPIATADGLLQQAITVLAHRPALLVLDNLEQMIPLLASLRLLPQADVESLRQLLGAEAFERAWE
jgi:hypothetical protein